MPNREFKLRTTYILAIAGFVFDQLTKFVARYYLESQSIDLGLLRFDLVFNTGAAYGLFSSYTQLLLIIGLFVIAYLFYALKSLVDSMFSVIAYGAILAGASGNTFDRLVSGRVTDFINIQIIPVFNFADVYLNIGIACIVLDYVISRKKTNH